MEPLNKGHIEKTLRSSKDDDFPPLLVATIFILTNSFSDCTIL